MPSTTTENSTACAQAVWNEKAVTIKRESGDTPTNAPITQAELLYALAGLDPNKVIPDSGIPVSVPTRLSQLPSVKVNTSEAGFIPADFSTGINAAGNPTIYAHYHHSFPQADGLKNMMPKTSQLQPHANLLPTTQQEIPTPKSTPIAYTTFFGFTRHEYATLPEGPWTHEEAVAATAQVLGRHPIWRKRRGIRDFNPTNTYPIPLHWFYKELQTIRRLGEERIRFQERYPDASTHTIPPNDPYSSDQRTNPGAEPQLGRRSREAAAQILTNL